MSGLASVLKERAKSTSTSSKTPQFYNEEKTHFINDMLSYSDASVRLIAAQNPHVPSKLLTNRLRDEVDIDVVRALLMNPNLPKKSIVQFATNDPRAKMFDDDQELIAYIDSMDLEK